MKSLPAFGLAAPIATSLIGGGPATIIWGLDWFFLLHLYFSWILIHSWVLISITTQPLALSLAEICSKYPTSAGAYYWCFRLTTPKRRILSSWINGWLTMVGVWTISLSVTFVSVSWSYRASRSCSWYYGQQGNCADTCSRRGYFPSWLDSGPMADLYVLWIIVILYLSGLAIGYL